jgi:hypothetical protein
LLIRFDHDGDGSINYLEFVNFCLAYAMDDPKKGGMKNHLASHGDRDAHESKLRTLLTHFIDSHGGAATALSNIFIQLTEQSLGNTVDSTAILDYFSASGTVLSVDEMKLFDHKFRTSSSQLYHDIIRFCYPLREDLRWDGDMYTVHKLRRITRLAIETETIQDYITAADLYVNMATTMTTASKNDNNGGNTGGNTGSRRQHVTAAQFEGILRSSWLDLTDTDVGDIMRRFLPEEDGMYSYEEFVSLSTEEEVVLMDVAKTMHKAEKEEEEEEGYLDDFEDDPAAGTVQENKEQREREQRKEQEEQKEREAEHRKKSERQKVLVEQERKRKEMEEVETQKEKERIEAAARELVEKEKREREEQQRIKQQQDQQKQQAKKERKASLLIQNGARKKLANNKVNGLRKERKSVTRIQSQARRKLAVKKVNGIKTYKKKQEKASLLIQNGARKKLAKNKVNGLRKERKSITRIQSQARRKLAVKKVNVMKEENRVLLAKIQREAKEEDKAAAKEQAFSFKDEVDGLFDGLEEEEAEEDEKERTMPERKLSKKEILAEHLADMFQEEEEEEEEEEEGSTKFACFPAVAPVKPAPVTVGAAAVEKNDDLFDLEDLFDSDFEDSDEPDKPEKLKENEKEADEKSIAAAVAESNPTKSVVPDDDASDDDSFLDDLFEEASDADGAEDQKEDAAATSALEKVGEQLWGGKDKQLVPPANKNDEANKEDEVDAAFLDDLFESDSSEGGNEDGGGGGDVATTGSGPTESGDSEETEEDVEDFLNDLFDNDEEANAPTKTDRSRRVSGFEDDPFFQNLIGEQTSNGGQMIAPTHNAQEDVGIETLKRKLLQFVEQVGGIDDLEEMIENQAMTCDQLSYLMAESSGGQSLVSEELKVMEAMCCRSDKMVDFTLLKGLIHVSILKSQSMKMQSMKMKMNGVQQEGNLEEEDALDDDFLDDLFESDSDE